jgi:alkylation response protein AidB-like acyl-CoA dehydrogenase
MALMLTEEHRMLQDAAAGFLSERAPLSALRRLRDGGNPTGFDRALWQAMADMGWAGIAVPEAYGGAALGYVGLGVVLEEVGRRLVVSPLQSTAVVAATLILRAGSAAQCERLLPALADGRCTATLALQEGARHATANITTTAVEDGDAYLLTGHKVLVQDVPGADLLIVAARSAGAADDRQGVSLFLVPLASDGVSVEPVMLVDSRQAARVHLQAVRVPADCVLGAPGEGLAALEQTLDIANVGLAAELLGLSLEAYERTLAYLKERRQFGLAIGSFQALQHRAAEMFAELELARSLVRKALVAIDNDDPDLPRLAAATKAKLCEVAERISNEAIQMHGGIGMTDEFDIGFFIKRARVAQQTFGDYHYQLDRFAALSGF